MGHEHKDHAEVFADLSRLVNDEYWEQNADRLEPATFARSGRVDDLLHQLATELSGRARPIRDTQELIESQIDYEQVFPSYESQLEEAGNAL